MVTLLLLGVGFTVFASESPAVDLKREKASGRYCDSPTLRDYEAPLRGLPLVNGSALRGQLPFAPLGVRLRRVSSPRNEGNVIAGSGAFGYQIIVGPEPGGVDTWKVRSALVSLTNPGTPEEASREAVVQIEKTELGHASSLVLQVPGKPGSYRYDIEFSDLAGVPLGKYSQYLQVLRPRLAFRVGIRGRSFRPGRFLDSRWENVGSALIEFTSDYWIERRIDGRWKLVPRGPSDVRGFPKRRRIGGGRTSHCMKVWLPKWLPKGLYRLAREAGPTSLDPGPRIPPRYTRTAVFRVR